jgi:PhoH-like ATPase
MKKTYVLDTNVLINDPQAIFSFDDNTVIIPMIVIEELDKLKNGHDAGQSARQVSRLLDTLREKGNLATGIDLPNGGRLKIESLQVSMSSIMPVELQDAKIYDNVLIATAKRLSAASKTDPVILVSKDVNVRIKCDTLGLISQDYLKNRVTTDEKGFYTGVVVVEDQSYKSVIDSIYAANGTGIEVPEELSDKQFYPNEIVVVKDGIQSSVISRVFEDVTGKKTIKKLPDIKDVMSLKPRNKEQNFVLSLLLDPDIKLVTITGAAGCGKTLLALAAGLEQLSGIGSSSTYEKMIITRPMQTVGKDIGFLPGTLQEKLDPWITPIKDNLNFLVGYKKMVNGIKRAKTKESNEDFEPYLALLMREGKIEVEAIPYIRGRSIPGSYFIIDEAQNLSVHELKTIITRSGEGTKVILTGDLQQIDNSHIDMYTNGLSYAVEKFKHHKIAGHITLLRGERSELATLAASIL